MRIEVDELSIRGRQVPFSREDEWAAGAVATALDGGLLQLLGAVRVERAGGEAKGGIQTTVRGRAMVDRVCDRCGAPLQLPVSVEESLLFLPAGSKVEESDSELEADDLDVGWFHNGVLDLSDVLSEAFALNLPMRVTCAVAAGRAEGAEPGNEAAAEAACTARMAPAAAGDDHVGNPFAVLSKLR